mmetsp:Transcript_32237/g.28558  ORF Transcript_32237/g.28558 Transcript_32237/m.28558 type:complete len:164 (-) Transcript_32237:58-549(-)
MFLELVKESLSDRIYIIRQQAIAVISRLALVFGVDWFCKTVLFYLYAFKSDNNYLHRQTPLFCLQSLNASLLKHQEEMGFFDTDFNQQLEAIIEFICQNCSDKVPNVRFLAIQTLSKYIELLKKDDKLKSIALKTIRSVFKTETDVEVKLKIKDLHKILKSIK